MGADLARFCFQGQGATATAVKQAKLRAIVPSGPSAKVFLSAGEASGDGYGAELIQVLRARLPEIECFGLGGRRMEAAGLRCVVRAEDVAVMGITEILRHVPRIYASYRRLVGAIRRERPGVVVLIDFPDVNFRLAKVCKRMGVPVVWMVSPQLWAWKRRRLRWVRERVAKMLVIFPFEEGFYRARGVEAEFVGHPLLERAGEDVSRSEFAGRYDLDLEKRWIALLPGSRVKEVAGNLPEMLRAAAGLEREESFEYLLPVASTLPREWMEEMMRDWAGGQPRITLVGEARAALRHARASVVASGTATVEAAVAGNPFVVVYRVSGLTFGLARRLVRYPAEIGAERDAAGNLPVAMVNLIAGERLVPELLQGRFTAEAVMRELQPLLEDGAARERQIVGLAEVRRRMVGDGPAIGRVAEVVLGYLGGRGGVTGGADEW